MDYLTSMKRYIVVEFVKEKIKRTMPSALVSKKWLYRFPNSLKDYCYWLDYSKYPEKLAQKEVMPGQNWSLHEIRILYQTATDNFAEAVKFNQEAVWTSNFEDSSSSEHLRQKRRRKKTYRKSLSSDSSISEDDEIMQLIQLKETLPKKVIGQTRKRKILPPFPIQSGVRESESESESSKWPIQSTPRSENKEQSGLKKRAEEQHLELPKQPHLSDADEMQIILHDTGVRDQSGSAEWPTQTTSRSENEEQNQLKKGTQEQHSELPIVSDADQMQLTKRSNELSMDSAFDGNAGRRSAQGFNDGFKRMVLVKLNYIVDQLKAIRKTPLVGEADNELFEEFPSSNIESFKEVEEKRKDKNFEKKWYRNFH